MTKKHKTVNVAMNPKDGRVFLVQPDQDMEGLVFLLICEREPLAHLMMCKLPGLPGKEYVPQEERADLNKLKLKWFQYSQYLKEAVTVMVDSSGDISFRRPKEKRLGNSMIVCLLPRWKAELCQVQCCKLAYSDKAVERSFPGVEGLAGADTLRAQGFTSYIFPMPDNQDMAPDDILTVVQAAFKKAARIYK